MNIISRTVPTNHSNDILGHPLFLFFKEIFKQRLLCKCFYYYGLLCVFQKMVNIKVWESNLNPVGLQLINVVIYGRQKQVKIPNCFFEINFRPRSFVLSIYAVR